MKRGAPAWRRVPARGRLAGLLHRETIKFSPDYFLAFYHLTFTYLLNNQIDEAIATSKKALSLSKSISLTQFASVSLLSVIGETARIGNNVKIYQGVTLGAKSFVVDDAGHPVKGVKRHPKLEDGVIVYPGATILGGETVIGENSIVGSNVWLMQSMPANSIAYYQGDTASIIRPRKKKEALLEEFSDWVI